VRRPARSTLALLVAGAAAVVAAACDDSGTYQVTAHLTANTCDLGAPDPWDLDVKVSRQGSTVSWTWLDGTAPISGPLNAQSEATLTGSQQNDVDGTVDGGPGPCTLERDDTVGITLSAGEMPATFSGTINYAFSVVTGSDCSDQLVASGGQYATLPCAITYSMTGSRQ
jgi:hypothetical protein